MKHEVITVTPEMAAHWLEVNPRNRPIRRGWVMELAGMIKRGEWRTTHQGIALDADGAVLDGQHRLSAIILADKPIQIMVTTGVPHEAFGVLDRGKSRSLRDLTGHSNNVIAIVTIINVLLETGEKVLTHGRAAPTHDQYMAVHGVFGAHAEYVVAHMGRHKKQMAAAPILTAATLRLIDGHDVSNQIKAMTTLNFAAMTPATQALTRQILNDDAKARDQLLARSWRAFDPKGEGVSYIRVVDPRVQVEEMRVVAVREYQKNRPAA